MGKDNALGLISDIMKLESEKDSFKFGKSSERWKIYANLENAEQVKEKIDNAIGAREYARKMDDEDAEDRREELMEQFLRKATEDGVIPPDEGDQEE